MGTKQVAELGLAKPLQDNEQQTPAIEASQVTYYYGSQKQPIKAVDRISFSVPKGTICTILGPSGCGKTTLIHCLVGQLKPQKGYVKVFGVVPGSRYSEIPGRGVGFMPQEIGLFDEMTVSETLRFFGKIFMMTNEEINERTKFLLEFLDIKADRMIQNLSGGQQRRVSLAVSLIHDPPLLILDEPTVGVDPVLRHNIWNYLVKLSDEKGITTVITTHYVEEARSAHLVCFVRSGRLLKKGNPNQLLHNLNVSTLEEVFLFYCRASGESETSGEERELKKMSSFKSVFDKTGDLVKRATSFATETKGQKKAKIGDQINKTIVLLHKNMVHHYRNLFLLFFMAMVPSLQAALFFLAIGNRPFAIPIAVVNLDGGLSNWSSLILNVQDSDRNFGQKFLNFIDNHTVNQVKFESLNDSLWSAKNEDYRGVIYIPANFSDSFFQRVYFLFSTCTGQNESSNLQIDTELVVNQSTVYIYPDESEQFLHAPFIRCINEAFVKFYNFLTHLQPTAMNIGERELRVLTSILKIEEPIFGERDPPLRNWFAPSFVIIQLLFAIIAPSALALIMEKKSGVLDRIFVAGVRAFEVVISHFINNAFILMVQTFILYLVVFIGFQIPCHGSMILVLSLILLLGMFGLSYGLFISAVSSDEHTAFILTAASLMPLMVLGGVIYPVDTMPKLLWWISKAIPTTHAIEATRFVMYRNWDLTYWKVILGFLVPTVWIVILLAITISLFSVKSK